jgi:hypothetical protein
MNPEMVGEKEKKAALILSFSPREKESLFPRLVKLDALSLRRFLDVVWRARLCRGPWVRK